MHALPPALAPLAAWPQFVCWYAYPDAEKPGKFAKFPIDGRTGAFANAHDRNIWTTADQAITAYRQWDRGYGAGIGFVFTEQDPFWFLDIDGAWDAAAQTWSPIALDLCAQFHGAAQEVSHSGKGLHLIGTGAVPDHQTRNLTYKLEFYHKARFVALTGTSASGDAASDHTARLAQVVPVLFPPGVKVERGAWTTEPVPEWLGPDDDDELIRRALAAASRDPRGLLAGVTTFADLWSANVPYDGKSEADLKLANQLAFWTGKNCERIERLMRKSALMREKWDDRAHRNYLTDTILKACAFTQSIYTGPPKQDPAASVAPPVDVGAVMAAGATLRPANKEYMHITDQVEHFQGCAFVIKQGKVWSTPRAALLTRPTFDVVYGGHQFIMDPESRDRVKSAYEAFTENRVIKPPIVDDMCFRPEIPSGAVIEHCGQSQVNTYVPYTCPATPGDYSPFTDLMSRLQPDEGDREILLNWMAHVAQNPGRKLQWWPVIQGVEGNGKTVLVRTMTWIVGEHYTHLPNTASMAKDGMKFNSWIYRKLFVGLEEMMLADRRAFLEEFKVIVTNDRIPIEGKGIDQVTGDNRANGVICTNHPDGVPINDKDRRYGIFFTPQQTTEDLKLWGLDGDYFPNFYDWFKGEGAWTGQPPGVEHIAHMLLTRAVTRVPHRAPLTTSRHLALAAGLGAGEQEVLEAIDEGRPGFSGGWVSSRYLDALLDAIKARVPRTKRRALMQSLGYDWHPALLGGRVNNVVTPDGGKPKLYLKTGHLALQLADPVQIAKAYSRAQEMQVDTPVNHRLGSSPT